MTDPSGYAKTLALPAATSAGLVHHAERPVLVVRAPAP